MQRSTLNILLPLALLTMMLCACRKSDELKEGAAASAVTEAETPELSEEQKRIIWLEGLTIDGFHRGMTYDLAMVACSAIGGKWEGSKDRGRYNCDATPKEPIFGVRREYSLASWRGEKSGVHSVYLSWRGTRSEEGTIKNIYDTVLANLKDQIGPPEEESVFVENEFFPSTRSIWSIGEDQLTLIFTSITERLNSPRPHSVYVRIQNKADISQANAK